MRIVIVNVGLFNNFALRKWKHKFYFSHNVLNTQLIQRCLNFQMIFRKISVKILVFTMLHKVGRYEPKPISDILDIPTILDLNFSIVCIILMSKIISFFSHSFSHPVVPIVLKNIPRLLFYLFQVYTFSAVFICKLTQWMNWQWIVMKFYCVV